MKRMERFGYNFLLEMNKNVRLNIDKVALLTGKSYRQVERDLKELELLGLIKIEKEGTSKIPIWIK